jgi:hypothetical protein
MLLESHLSDIDIQNMKEERIMSMLIVACSVVLKREGGGIMYECV